MISRRAFLGLSAVAVTSPVWSRPLGFPSAAAATPDTFTLNLVNQSSSDTVYGYVAGSTLDDRLVLLRADGSPYYPPSPGNQVPLGEDCAIPLSGGGTRVQVPKMKGARIYVVTGDKLEFFVNPGPALVNPSIANPDDANFDKDWSFCEFTYNDTQLFANISYVDFVASPIGLNLTTASGGTQNVAGLPARSLGEIADAVRGQGGSWGQLVQTAGDGRVLRVVSAQNKASAFTGYLDGYIDQVWQKYAGTDLVIDTQRGDLGKLTGRVGGDGRLTFASVGESLAKPVTADVWSCDSGPFAIPGGASEPHKAIVPRIAAALNRTTLLANANQPDGEDPGSFYRGDATNHYARIVHEHLPDNRGYAFPYDDVTPGQDFSGSVFAGDPQVLTVTVNALR